MSAGRLLADRDRQGGTLTVESIVGLDVGRWHVTGDGRFCQVWQVGDRGRLRCHYVHRDGDDIELRADDRWSVLRFRRVPAP